MKACGWYVNLPMRRVEFVTAAQSIYNNTGYGKYQGPNRSYMLNDSAVYDTETEALIRLHERMTGLYYDREEKQSKLWTAILSVSAAIHKSKQPK